MKTVNNESVDRGSHKILRGLARMFGVLALSVGTVVAVQSPAMAGDRGHRVASAVIGAGVGALVGHHIGGRDAARIGGVIGAAVGLTAVRDHGYAHIPPARSLAPHRYRAPVNYWVCEDGYRHSQQFRPQRRHQGHAAHYQRRDSHNGRHNHVRSRDVHKVIITDRRHDSHRRDTYSRRARNH